MLFFSIFFIVSLQLAVQLWGTFLGRPKWPRSLYRLPRLRSRFDSETAQHHRYQWKSLRQFYVNTPQTHCWLLLRISIDFRVFQMNDGSTPSSLQLINNCYTFSVILLETLSGIRVEETAPRFRGSTAVQRRNTAGSPVQSSGHLAQPLRINSVMKLKLGLPFARVQTAGKSSNRNVSQCNENKTHQYTNVLTYTVYTPEELQYTTIHYNTQQYTMLL